MGLGLFVLVCGTLQKEPYINCLLPLKTAALRFRRYYYQRINFYKTGRLIWFFYACKKYYCLFKGPRLGGLIVRLTQEH